MEPSKIDQRSFSPKQLNKTLPYCPFRQETKIPVSTFELHYFPGALPTASRVWACHTRTAITLHPTPRPRRVSQVRTPEAPPFVPGTHQAANAGKPQAPHHRQPLPWLLRIRPSPIINRAIGKIPTAQQNSHTNGATRPHHAIIEPRAHPCKAIQRRPMPATPSMPPRQSKHFWHPTSHHQRSYRQIQNGATQLANKICHRPSPCDRLGTRPPMQSPTLLLHATHATTPPRPND